MGYKNIKKRAVNAVTGIFVLQIVDFRLLALSSILFLWLFGTSYKLAPEGNRPHHHLEYNVLIKQLRNFFHRSSGIPKREFWTVVNQ
jgi:hypothetical protein